MSLKDPTVKMSKSAEDPNSRILLTDSMAQITEKLRTALTDEKNYVSWEPETRPGVSNLLELMSYMDRAKRSPQEIASSLHGAGANLGQLKSEVAETVNEALQDIRARYDVLMRDKPSFLDLVAREGAEEARESAERTMSVVRSAVGLGD